MSETECHPKKARQEAEEGATSSEEFTFSKDPSLDEMWVLLQVCFV